MNLQMYCVFSKEAIKLMGGNRGKLGSMAGHAYLHSYWDAAEKAWNNRYHKNSGWAAKYKLSGFAKKVTVFVETTAELQTLYDEIKDIPCLGSSLVIDKGLTVFNGPTCVALGVGPLPENEIPECLASLKGLV